MWLDNITRDLLDNGTLKRYIDEFSITGLTSNPTIFEHAISKSKSYDAEIGRLLSRGLSGEELFFELALQDLIVPPTFSPRFTNVRPAMTASFRLRCRLF